MNAIRNVELAANRVMSKRRRRAAWLVMRVANAFFRLARNPVEAIANDVEWRAWEVDCFRLLHRPEFTAGVDESGTPFVSVLPGADLSRHLAAGTLRAEHLAAAGAELRRAHCFHSRYHGAAWSHGDPHTGNFLFDAQTGRARLVDFEMRHHRDLPEARRHADDLLVLLQDVCGRCAADEWLPLAEAFLAGYGRAEIIASLADLLHVPRGIPRVWWAVRTSWMRRAELELRVAALRAALSASCRWQDAGTLLPMLIRLPDNLTAASAASAAVPAIPAASAASAAVQNPASVEMSTNRISTLLPA